MVKAPSIKSDAPLVVVVGRPNVGKSALVNRIVGKRVAIVEETPGVTRDRHVMAAAWSGVGFDIVDTGGWLQSGGLLEQQISSQAEKALNEADVVLFVLDATVGLTDEDADVARLLRKTSTPVLVVANKVDSAAREADAWSFTRLGLGDPWMVSALHGRGSGDLLDEVIRQFEATLGVSASEDPLAETDGFTAAGLSKSASVGTGLDFDRSAIRDELDDTDLGITGSGISVLDNTDLAAAEGSEHEDLDLETPAGEIPSADVPANQGLLRSGKMPAVAIVGRPNVGKSTLFNRLVGEERSVTHDMPGTTTDAIDTVLETPDGAIKLVDTAGMRRRAKTARGSEYYSLVRALQAIDSADVALLVIDCTEGVTHQDQRLAERIDAAGSPVVLVANKWDALDTEQRAQLREDMADRLGFLSYAPLVPISALTGRNVHKLMPALRQSLSAYGRRVPTGELNTVVQAAQRAHPAPNSRVLYATQGAVEPPTITLFATRELPASWLRYMERMIREHFALGPTPLELRVRRRDSSGGGAGRRGKPGKAAR